MFTRPNQVVEDDQIESQIEANEVDTDDADDDQTPAPYRGPDQRRLLREKVEQKVREQEQAPTSLTDPSNEDHSDTVSRDEKLSPEEKTFKKRYSDLRRHHDKAIRELRDEINALKSSGGPSLPTSEEQLTEWMEKYPDVANIVRTIAIKEAKEIDAKTRQEIERLNEERREAAREANEARLLKLHPDFPELRESDEFHTWAANQPEQIQTWLYDSDGDYKLVARALDLYKADNKPKGRVKEEDDSRDAARSVRKNARVDEPTTKRTGKVFKESEVAAMKPWEFDKLEEEIDRARREGRFIYDL